MHVRRTLLVVIVGVAFLLPGLAPAEEEPDARPYVTIRGIYGGVPTTLMENGRTLPDAGVNAVWIGARGITQARIQALRAQGAQVFAEFNTLHRADYLKAHPDAAPVGPDGQRAEAPHGWQGICPTHDGYRRERMEAFRALLTDHEIDGVWLDYLHAHASWERADPALPDTCFCAHCLARFQSDTGHDLLGLTTKQAAARLLGSDRGVWVAWRCGVLTDWVREFKAIRDATRPKALLGTFHCPWSSEDHDGALRAKLAIDLRAQARYIDVFSPMPYHARFGHTRDPAWISRQTAWLAKHLRLGASAYQTTRIWPIVQLSDWGEPVPVTQVAAVLDHATRPPSTGVMVFAWGSLRKQPEKVEALVRAYRAFAGSAREDEYLPVSFEHGKQGTRRAPRYSPKGYRVTLEPRVEEAPEGLDALQGRLLLGPETSRGDGHLLVLARSAEGQPYDRLWIDTDGDGTFEDETLCTADPSVKRGTVYTSFDAVMQVNHGSDNAPQREPYAIGLWVAVDSEDATPPFIRFSRRSFLAGAVTINDTAYNVVLSDADNDAVYGAGDWWAVLPSADGGMNDISGSRKVGDFAWADGEAYRLELDGTRGRSGRLVAVDPGLTPEEDARARDPYWDDRHAERAETPLAFRHDVDLAIREAKERGAPWFLDFETVWCGPCKSMDRWVYTAKAVVSAAEGIVCIKVDGDEREDLKKHHGVGAFPTGILFGPGGKELARFSGYQSVTDLIAFFAKTR